MTLTKASRKTVNALPAGQGVGTSVNIRYQGLPASQPALRIRYPGSVLFAQMDKEYVALPKIEKKKRAGDKPSHRVLKFFTRKASATGCPKLDQQLPHRSVVPEPLTSGE